MGCVPHGNTPGGGDPGFLLLAGGQGVMLDERRVYTRLRSQRVYANRRAERSLLLAAAAHHHFKLGSSQRSAAIFSPLGKDDDKQQEASFFPSPWCNLDTF